ncbi:MAG: 1-deoxy-D-xylulose-5-phosphate reductoisomerase [SAR116 cluster bacterium]|nr:1-deoxy-D-xylulose-5-phosphate reductoisomerase [SAR116 cluster bacterium]
MKKKIIILGATGSIGQSTLEIIKHFKNDFEVVGISSHQNQSRMVEISKYFEPKNIIFTDLKLEKKINKLGFNKGSKLFFGSDSFSDFLNIDYDLLINGISGFAGLQPTFIAVKKGKDIAIANKESIVAGGNLLIEQVKKYGSRLIPVDSEHNALSQILKNYHLEEIERITITASGGPFRKDNFEMLRLRKQTDALKHPTWEMGPKNTIDSATLMNKGLEVIEASILFSLPSNKIDVLVHPESIMHGLVTLIDGGIITYMSQPDMKIPIFNALYFPKISKHFVKQKSISSLNFYNLNEEIFPSIRIARIALEKGFIATNYFNASNEVAVKSFLDEKIKFTDIFSIVEKVTNLSSKGNPNSIEEVFKYDKLARELSENEVNKIT